MADILNYIDQQSTALHGEHGKQVGLNQRRMIESILTQYSSDFAVLRETIQNADDAQATSFHFEIKCDVPSSSAVTEKNFHNQTITEFRMTNNGKIFSETDWKRVAIIAEGNTDPQSVGQFGVGFFSVFSYSEEPIIVSGKEYMKFFWRDDILLYELLKLPTSPQSQETIIILKMRDKHILRMESTLDIRNDGPLTINMAQLKAYFAKVLSFTRNIVNLYITINGLKVFQISKTKSLTPSVQDASTFRLQPSVNYILYHESFIVTEQIFTIANGPSITLGHVIVEARLNLDQQTGDHIRRILKSLPSTIQIQLLFVPINIIANQQQMERSIANDNLNNEILNSLLPLKFLNNEIIPSGFIFIGLGTHQSIGIGMHVYSHFIPTIERENLNLQDPYIAKWNKELLAYVGQIARCMYHQTMTQISHSKSDTRYDAVMAPYSFQSTAPNARVGEIVRRGFFALSNTVLVPVRRQPSDQHLSLMASTKVFLANSEHIHKFLSLPLVPYELSKNCFFTILKEYQLISIADLSVIANELSSAILSCNELIELFNWLCSNTITDHSYVKRILSVVRFRETTRSSVTSFKKLKYYDASNISLDLPLPESVLLGSISQHFSPGQLQHNLFLSPCTFKDLINSYLHESQHYLFERVTTSTSLLSHLSRHSGHFSESQWMKIKNILSTLKCIPTTHGMKLPSQSYIPSPILTSDSPAITLNLLSDKALINQKNSATNEDEKCVSVYFLKQIGCRMIDIQSLIKYQPESSDLSTMNQENMQSLIKNLMKERSNMTNADLDALKQSKFLQGTVQQPTCTIKEYYAPRDLHFPSVANELQWPELLILDWHDIDAYPAEYEFLKALGVREIPDLNNLINRIVFEHENTPRRRNYRLPVTLSFFAKNFQKHYSSLWKTSDIQRPFLPSYLPSKNNVIDVILSVPKKVFVKSNPLCVTLLPAVTQLFETHSIISLLGITECPTVAQAFDVLMERKDEFLRIDSADQIFEYLNTLDGLNQTFIKRLSTIAFIPLEGESTLLKPSRVFIEQVQPSISKQIDTSGLIDYVDFGSEGNSFLLSVGVLPFPPIPVLAELLIERQESYFANLSNDENILKHKLDAYTYCLKRLALTLIQTPESYNVSLENRLRNERWCLGFQRINITDSETTTFRVVKPTEIYLNDDHQCELSHRPLCFRDEPELMKLYQHFGARWLSDCVTRKLKPIGKHISTDRSNDLRNTIQSRLNILFVDKQGNSIADRNEEHFQLLERNLSVYEVKGIQCHLTFQNKTEILQSNDSSSCALEQNENGVILYLQQDLEKLDYFDIAKELARFVLKNPLDIVIYSIIHRLSSSSDALARHDERVKYLIIDRGQVVPPPLRQEQRKISPSRLTKFFGMFLHLGRITGNKKSDPNPSPHVPYSQNTINPAPNQEEDERPEIKRPSDELKPNQSSPELPHRQGDQQKQIKLQSHVNKPSTVFKPIEDFGRARAGSSKRIRDLVDGSGPYRGHNFVQKGHIRQEYSESCEVVPDANMKCFEIDEIPISFFVEQNVQVTSEMISQAKQLAYLLTGLATHVFKLHIKALHLFRDIDGRRIAFNASGALFFNLRYFEQVYAKKLKAHLQKPRRSNSILTRIVNFYFMVMCHELVHNQYPQHDVNFIHELEYCAVEFMMQKEIFLTQFSFDSSMGRFNDDLDSLF